MSTMTMIEARDRFAERVDEFTSKARIYFRGFKPEARDEAVQHSLFVAYYYLPSLVERGKCDDKIMLSSFWFACRKTYHGHKVRLSCKGSGKDLFSHATSHNDFNMDGFVTERDEIPDIVSYRVDTARWLKTLTPTERRRARDLGAGYKPSECAVRWKVSRAAVSGVRKQLTESYARFMAD